jgi:hypothetical protein
MKKVPRAAEAKSNGDEVAVEAALDAAENQRRWRRIDSGGAKRVPSVVRRWWILTSLEYVKRALGFIVDSLGCRDRLIVVAISDDAWWILHLTRMSEDGKFTMKHAVESLVTAGSRSTTSPPVRRGGQGAQRQLA